MSEHLDEDPQYKEEQLNPTDSKIADNSAHESDPTFIR